MQPIPQCRFIAFNAHGDVPCAATSFLLLLSSPRGARDQLSTTNNELHQEHSSKLPGGFRRVRPKFSNCFIYRSLSYILVSNVYGCILS